MGEPTNRQLAAKDRLDEHHSDTCRMWGLFGAGCDCGASEAARNRIVREAVEGFRRDYRAALQAKAKDGEPG